jgi:hypothetical protein
MPRWAVRGTGEVPVVVGGAIGYYLPSAGFAREIEDSGPNAM